MANHSNIEWTEATWNPVTGCTKVSAGCKNCYAERLAFRLQAMGNARYRNGFSLTLHQDIIELPKRWRESRLIFVNSVHDLHQEQVLVEIIQHVFLTGREFNGRVDDEMPRHPLTPSRREEMQLVSA